MPWPAAAYEPPLMSDARAVPIAAWPHGPRKGEARSLAPSAEVAGGRWMVRSRSDSATCPLGRPGLRRCSDQGGQQSGGREGVGALGDLLELRLSGHQDRQGVELYTPTDMLAPKLQLSVRNRVCGTAALPGSNPDGMAGWEPRSPRGNSDIQVQAGPTVGREGSYAAASRITPARVAMTTASSWEWASSLARIPFT